MTAIGRALMARPKMILDEPSMGLAPQLVEKIFELSATSTSSACRFCSGAEHDGRCASPTTVTSSRMAGS
jgi:ABC-type branched-subunit amino acid transport system ATPase component